MRIHPGKAIAVALAIGLAGPLPAVAAAPAHAGLQDVPLSLADAILLARQNSLAAQSGRQTMKVDVANRGVTYAQALPSFQLQSSINYSELPGLGNLGSLSNLTFFPANGVTAQNNVNASWTVFDAFATRDALQISDLMLRADELNVVQSEQDAMETAAEAYIDVVKDEALVRVDAEAVQHAQVQLSLGNARYSKDLITRADLLQLKAQLGNALNTYAQAQNAVATARLTLSNDLNAPVGARALEPQPAVPAVRLQPEPGLRQALMIRPDVVAAQMREQSDRKKVDLQAKAAYPTVAMTSSYSQRNLDPGQFSAALQMTWNVFDGFKVRHQVEAAVAQAQSTHISLEQTRQKATLDVEQAYQNLANAQAQLSNSHETLKSAEEAYRLGLERFKLSLATQFDLADIQNTLTQAQYNDVSAMSDLRIAQIKLARSLGFDLAAFLKAPAPVPPKQR